MMQNNEEVVILMADDDKDDVLLTRRALKKSRLINKLVAVRDGEELLEYLKNQGKYSDAKEYSKPGIILLDLNMPKKDGREALREIKEDPGLKDIPVVVFTTSQAEEDIYRSYKLGVNSFITKPVRFEDLIEVMTSVGNYWFKVVKLPNTNGHT